MRGGGVGKVTTCKYGFKVVIGCLVKLGVKFQYVRSGCNITICFVTQ